MSSSRPSPPQATEFSAEVLYAAKHWLKSVLSQNLAPHPQLKAHQTNKKGPTKPRGYVPLLDPVESLIVAMLKAFDVNRRDAEGEHLHKALNQLKEERKTHQNLILTFLLEIYSALYHWDTLVHPANLDLIIELVIKPKLSGQANLVPKIRGFDLQELRKQLQPWEPKPEKKPEPEIKAQQRAQEQKAQDLRAAAARIKEEQQQREILKRHSARVLIHNPKNSPTIGRLQPQPILLPDQRPQVPSQCAEATVIYLKHLEGVLAQVKHTRLEFKMAWEKYKIVKKLAATKDLLEFKELANTHKETLSARRDSHFVTFAKALAVIGLTLLVVVPGIYAYWKFFGSHRSHGAKYMSEMEPHLNPREKVKIKL